MHIAAPWLLIAGGYVLGLMFHAFGRHKAIGFSVIVVGVILITLGLAGYSVTVPRNVQVNQPSHSASPSPSHSLRYTERKTEGGSPVHARPSQQYRYEHYDPWM